MIELRLLDSFTGKQSNTMRTKHTENLKNAKAEVYLNILLLFVDYKVPSSGIVDQNKLDKDRKAIVKRLYETYPFGDPKYRAKVNIFTPTDQPDLGVVYANNIDVSGFAFKKSLKENVKKYSYQSFIKNGDVWLWDKKLVNRKRSEGCVCVVSGREDHLGAYISFDGTATVLPKWKKKKNARSQPIGHFLIASSINPDDSPIKAERERRESLTYTFLHELGHALNLKDEYEAEIDTSGSHGNDGFWRKNSSSLVGPNVVSKKILLKPVNNEGVFPSVKDINPDNIPWKIMLGGNFNKVSIDDKEKLLNLNKHKSRITKETECKGNYHQKLQLCLVADRGQFEEKLKSSNQLSKENRIGLYEGGDSKSFDIYRPHKACRMRQPEVGHRNKGYCSVCKQWIIYRISEDSFNANMSSFNSWLKDRAQLFIRINQNYKKSLTEKNEEFIP